MKMNFKLGLMAGCAGLLVFAAQAGALERLHSFSGRVERITDGEFEVVQGRDTRHFEIEDLKPEDQKNLKPGDRVTVWYSMEAKRVTRDKAGRAGSSLRKVPSEIPAATPAAPAIPAVQDDRAFYNAKNEKPRSDETVSRSG